ncbi:ferric reduction oxidase 2-like [Jatropha curcas]|uniref:ferric reduction oxidase 2-like n=1 Tax=Jatropha curcas TaxID=180498 RepID=UPI0009D74EFB|nr:ferric reduction oxidase 2-like [Jatropha curcas]
MKMVQSAIRVFIAVVFLGYMMIWVMKATNTYYLHWLPNIHSHINSTFFGEQGANMLVYTFPVLFIAALACAYLHLGKKFPHQETENRKVDSWFGWWRRPVLVKGPLGIVLWIEISFLGIFFALLIWSFYSYLHDLFAYASLEAAYSGIQLWEAKLENAGLSLGLVGNVCLAFLFFPVTRGSSILQFIGLTSEASIKYHIWLGHTTLAIFTAHGLCYLVFWAKTNQLSQILKWDKFLVSNLGGEIALLFGLIMWITSLNRIRRNIFELFFYTHYLYILFVVFYVFHVGFSDSCIVLAGFYLYVIDRYLRLLQSQQRVALVSARILPCDTLELNFSKSPELSCGLKSMAFINVPEISKLQWHPFTIISNTNMEPEKLTMVIKCEGNWCQELYQILSSPSPVDRLEVSIEGPYGLANSTDYMRHDLVVMVSGGSGITPFISIFREMLFIANTTNVKTPRILLVCTFKKSINLTMLDLLLPVSGTTPDLSLLQLEIEAYITSEKELEPENQKLRTIWFKPNASDVPVSAVLGPNGWLWLAAIISTSFIVFLILIGILTRYYMYPIDHNTNMMYSMPARSALNMLFISVSIVMTASAAFVWNKKHNAKEMKQIQNIDTPTPGMSPVCLQFHDTERELENLPYQSLLQATSVHLGQRPDFKKILLECKGDCVGVLVSGPKQMRQEVAAICSSSSVQNLHFEAISFSW